MDGTTVMLGRTWRRYDVVSAFPLMISTGRTALKPVDSFCIYFLFDRKIVRPINVV